MDRTSTSDSEVDEDDKYEVFEDHASIPPLPQAACQFYSDLASGDREREGLLLGLRFFGLAATPLAGDAIGDRDFAGDLDGERPFDE